MYRQMRGWRHDYRNHIQTLKVLAGEWRPRRHPNAYLDQLDTDLNTVDTGGENRQPYGRRHPQQQDFAGPGAAHPHAGGRAHPGAAAHVRAGPVLHSGQSLRQRHRGQPRPAGGSADDPCLHGHEGHAAVHLLHQLHRRQKAGEDRRGASAPPRARATALAWCASTPSSSGWMAISAATARTAPSPPRF